MNAASAAAVSERKKGKRQCRLKRRTRHHRTFSSRLLSAAVKTDSTLLALFFLVPFVSNEIYILIRSFPRAI